MRGAADPARFIEERPRPPMFKALLRLLSMVLLAVAVIMAVVDATRSIAAGAPVMTPLRSAWMAVSPQSYAGFEAWAGENLPALVWDPALLWLLSLPGFAIFAALWLLAALAGRRRARPGADLYAA